MKQEQKEALAALIGVYTALSAVLLGGSVYAEDLRPELLRIWSGISGLIRMCFEVALAAVLSRRISEKLPKQNERKEQSK